MTNDQPLTRTVCRTFALGEPLAPPSAVPGGLANRLWRVETSRGVFAVKQMDRIEAPGWYDRAFALEQAAWASGVPMPRPVPAAATGCCLAELRASDGTTVVVRAHEWVEGSKLDNGVVYADRDVERIAALLAKIHALRMQTGVTAREALLAFGDDHWRALADRAEREEQPWAAEMRVLLAPLHDLEQYLRDAHEDPTPLLVSHRDADPKNVMRTGRDELLLVDWDQAGPVNSRQDLADHALVWAGIHRDEPDPHAVRTFVAAYRAAGGTSEPFRPTDLGELVAKRLGWIEFNVHRALGEQTRTDLDRLGGMQVIRRNTEQLPRILRRIDPWLALLNSA